MIKKIQFLICIFMILFIFNSCFYIVSDKPYYYSDYEDPETSASYNYYYTYSYSNYPAYVPVSTPTPIPTPVIIEQNNINIIILKVVDNKHIFYRNNKEIAVWHFYPDGRIERKGENINGKVIRYYDNSDIIEWEFEYKNNLRWGKCNRYFNNGKLWEEVYYNNGKREGPYKTFYTDGKLREEVKYVGGNRDGVYRIYDENGKIVEHGSYKKEKKEVKFRDENYFKQIKDRDNMVTGQGQSVNIDKTQTPEIKQFQNKGFPEKNITPVVKNEKKESDEAKERVNQEQGQVILEQKIEAEQSTKNTQIESKFIETKKQKNKKQYNKHLKEIEKNKDNEMDKMNVYQNITGQVKQKELTENDEIKIKKDTKRGKGKEKSMLEEIKENKNDMEENNDITDDNKSNSKNSYEKQKKLNNRYK